MIYSPSWAWFYSFLVFPSSKNVAAIKIIVICFAILLSLFHLFFFYQISQIDGSCCLSGWCVGMRVQTYADRQEACV